MNKNTWLYQNKVFLTGLVLALLTSVSELFKTDLHPSLWVLLWSLSLAVLSYLSNNLRGQAASIITMLLTTAYTFYEAHHSPDGLNLHEAINVYILPLAIKVIGLFWVTPPKNKAYEYDPVIEQAKENYVETQPLFNTKKEKL